MQPMPSQPEQVQYEVPHSLSQNRLTTAFRAILAIPHLILASAIGYAVELVAIVHWFIQVFTGNRNAGIHNFSVQWLDYDARVYGYAALQFDPYPGFWTDDGKTPVQFALGEPDTVNRLTVGLRFIWAIPCVFIAAVLAF